MPSIYEKCVAVIDEFEAVLNLSAAFSDKAEYTSILEEKIDKLHKLKEELQELEKKVVIQ